MEFDTKETGPIIEIYWIKCHELPVLKLFTNPSKKKKKKWVKLIGYSWRKRFSANGKTGEIQLQTNCVDTENDSLY